MRTLAVNLYDEPVGTLIETDERRYLFTFTSEFIERGDQAPILSLGLLSPAKRPRSQRNTAVNIPPFFSNLLPESLGPLRAFLASQDAIDPGDDMGLLRVLGSDLPGAVTIAPSEDFVPLKQPEVAEQPAEPRRFRFSLAGVQMKFSVIRMGDGAFKITQSGEDGDYILKLPDTRKLEFTVNEQAMMQFARACGIDVPETGLVPLENIAGLPERFRSLEEPGYFIRRFDRGEQRIHIEDFAQILRVQPERKYEGVSYDHLLSLVFSLLGEQATTDFIWRLVFTIAIANADMHLKNWSVIYNDPYVPSLAPAYDYMCIGAYPQYDDKLGLPLAKVVRWNALQAQTFLDAARHAKPAVPSYIVRKALRESVSAILETWETFRKSTEIPPAIEKTIDRQITEVPLFSAVI